MPFATTIREPIVPANASRARGSEELDLFRVWAARIRESDANALEAFFRAVQGPLVRYASRYVPESAAEDVVQDAFVRSWNGRHLIDPSRSLKAFAYRIVRNLSLNSIRDGRTREALLSEHYETADTTAADPDEDLARADLAMKLHDWIEELPDRQREALELTRFENLTHAEVAEAMGVSPRTVNNHLVRALRALRNRMRAHDLTPMDS